MSLNLLLLAASVASAQDEPQGGLRDNVSLSGAFDTKARYYMAADDALLPGFEEYARLYDYFEHVSRTNLMLNHDRWQVGAQVDTVAMAWNWYYLDDQRTYEFDLLGEGVRLDAWDDDGVWQDVPVYATVEKMWASAYVGPATVTVGDSYATFGRGLAFNLVRNAQIDIDTTVRGVQVQATPGLWNLQALTGVVNQVQVQLENPNRELRANRNHAVHGVQVARYGVGPLTVSAHGVAYSFAQDLDDPNWNGFVRYGDAFDPSALVGGATVEGFTGPLDWYIEGDWFHYRDPLLGEDPGYAVYGSASFYPGPLSVFIEGKKYKNSNKVHTYTATERYQIVSGPTLEYERVITEDSSSAVTSNDIYGGRIQVDWSAVPGQVTPYVALGVHRDNDLVEHFNPSPETILHPMIGADIQGDLVSLWTNAGYRRDIRDDAADGADQLMHLDAALGFPLPGEWHADSTWDIWYFQWGNNAVAGQNDFVTSTLALAAHHHPSQLSFIVYNDVTNDPLLESEGNITDSVYLAGEVQWMPNGTTQIKAFYGAYRAGIRCAGGQCRMLPGFDGARVTVTTTF